MQGQLELVAAHFASPSAMTIDPEGIIYIGESAFDGTASSGRIWRLVPSGGVQTLVAEGFATPITGLVYHKNVLYISEGGKAGRISSLDLSSFTTRLLYEFAGPGNSHTNEVVIGPDERLYFSQGARTNMGIIGLDAYELPWIRKLPHDPDIPGYDIVLCGVNIETDDPLSTEKAARTFTGAFVPFGTQTEQGQRIAAQLPCSAAVMCMDPDGSNLELVAWGLRNAYALGFLPDGRLLTIDQGGDDRGSRPVGNAPDLFFEVRKGAWYGWPDFIGGDPITSPGYQPMRGPAPTFLLANHQELPPPEQALLRFDPHVGAVKFAAIPSTAPEYAGQLAVALFGDEFPLAAPSGAPVGRMIARVDPRDWSFHPLVHDPRLARPIDVEFDPNGNLYVLDFGSFEVAEGGQVIAGARSGKLWRLV